MQAAPVSVSDFSDERKAVFLERVERHGPDECWPWKGGKHENGYGYFRLGKKHMHKAHRVAYAFAHGFTPGDLFVLHKCDNPPCCNPAHLWLGTNLDNIADRDRKGRQAKGDRHNSRLRPESLARGERNGAHTHPEKIAGRGEKNRHAKLTEAEVREIYRLRTSGNFSRIKVAIQFGVSESQVKNIVSGKAWKHLGLVTKGKLLTANLEAL